MAFGLIARLGSKLVRSSFTAARAATGAALSVPGVRTAVKATGIGATVLGVGGALIPQGSKMPALPGMPGAGGFPGQAGPGDRSIFRDDPNVVEALKPYAIPMRGLRTYYRAPKGFVVMKDQVGDAYGIPKAMAKMYLGWKPAKKPPISVGDWSKLMGARRTMKKLGKVVKTGQSLARFATMGKGRGGGNLQINHVKGGAGDDVIVMPKKSFRKVG